MSETKEYVTQAEFARITNQKTSRISFFIKYEGLETKDFFGVKFVRVNDANLQIAKRKK